MNTYSSKLNHLRSHGVTTVSLFRPRALGNDNPIKGLILLFALLFLLGHSARCDTPVSGTVPGGEWTMENSPYCVTGDVQVFGTLIIRPGVTVRFDGNYEFQVGGRVQADGVLFTPLNGTNCWKGIVFFDSVPGSFFNNTIIEGACRSGVRITNTPPAFTNCIIRNNSSPDYGGGILAEPSGQPLVLVGCSISNNIAASSYGGGIFVEGALVLLQSIVVSNRCDTYGGGVFSRYGNCTLQNCNFAFNTSDGIYFDGDTRGGTLTMANCLVVTNRNGRGLLGYGRARLLNCISAGNTYEGLYLVSGPSAVINCTVVGNGPGYWGIRGGTVAVTNSILYFNNGGAGQFGGTVNFAYSDVQDALVPGPGNIRFAPGLCPNLTLIQGSPCIDAGHPHPIFNDECIDNAGTCTTNSRGTNRNDMGAFGGPGACCWTQPCRSPVITYQPPYTTACIGSSAGFCVAVVGALPLQYQWRFHGTNISNAATNIANATNSCFAISNVQSNNAGYYSVRVVNGATNAVSSRALLNVTPICVGISISNQFVRLSLTNGITSHVYQVQYATDVHDLSWSPLTTVTQRVSGAVVIDPQPATLPRRYYRVLP